MRALSLVFAPDPNSRLHELQRSPYLVLTKEVKTKDNTRSGASEVSYAYKQTSTLK